MTDHHNPLCSYEELHPLIREVFPLKDEAHLRRLSQQGNAPPYYRFGTQKSSPALWRKIDWYEFAKGRWGCLRPDLIQKMIDAGFEPAPTSNMVKKEKAKAKGKKVSP